MKKALIMLIAACCAALLLTAGCGSGAGEPGAEQATEEYIYQASVLSAIKAGEYDGDVTIEQLQAKGDMGIGTFQGLDGEMIVLAGKVYQVGIDGKPVSVPPETLTPFACVTEFRSEIQENAGKQASLAELQAFIDSKLPTVNLFYAITVDCTLPEIQVRSVPEQTKPYQPLADVLAAQQKVFDLKDVEGTLVGFRYPDFARDIGQAGYHWHFLTDDRDAGGHVLSLSMDTGSIEIDKDYRLELVLPANEEFNKTTPLLAPPASTPASSPANP